MPRGASGPPRAPDRPATTAATLPRATSATARPCSESPLPEQEQAVNLLLAGLGAQPESGDARETIFREHLERELRQEAPLDSDRGRAGGAERLRVADEDIAAGPEVCAELELRAGEEAGKTAARGVLGSSFCRGQRGVIETDVLPERLQSARRVAEERRLQRTATESTDVDGSSTVGSHLPRRHAEEEIRSQIGLADRRLGITGQANARALQRTAHDREDIEPVALGILPADGPGAVRCRDREAGVDAGHAREI